MSKSAYKIYKTSTSIDLKEEEKKKTFSAIRKEEQMIGINNYYSLYIFTTFGI